MVAIPSLLLPILLSAVIVFIVSSILHMALPWHKGDFKRAANEDALMDALRAANLAPGDYMIPCPTSPSDLKNPAFLEKFNRGPRVVMTVFRPGPMNMAPNLIGWFVYSLVVGVFAAYIAGRALGPGAGYLAVFRFAGCTAFLGYGLALAQDSIWYSRQWGTTLKTLIDALIYGMLTAGTFGWLWPR